MRRSEYDRYQHMIYNMMIERVEIGKEEEGYKIDISYSSSSLKEEKETNRREMMIEESQLPKP